MDWWTRGGKLEQGRPGIFCFLSASTVWECKNVHKVARSEIHQNEAKMAFIVAICRENKILEEEKPFNIGASKNSQFHICPDSQFFLLKLFVDTFN